VSGRPASRSATLDHRLTARVNSHAGTTRSGIEHAPEQCVPQTQLRKLALTVLQVNMNIARRLENISQAWVPPAGADSVCDPD
jgi:hypothetical protein